MSGEARALAAPALAPESARAVAQARAALEGRRRGLAALWPFLGPAFIASVAYIDPGNFATDIAAGSQFGYRLLWVVVFANLSAMLVQALSAKIGVATGRNLAELCREHYGTAVSYVLWVIGELGAMVTDVAEFIGAALGFYLLLGIPLIWGAGLAGVTTFLVLALERRGFRRLEAVIAAFVFVVTIAYVLEVALARPAGLDIVRAALAPSLPPGSLYLAVGILGATIMPHVVFLHSGLTQSRVRPRSEAEARAIYRYAAADVVVAMGLAGLINASMLVMASAVFAAHGRPDVVAIEDAHKTLAPLLGPAAAAAFAIALLASGLSSSAVGTMAGQVVMQGFVRFAIPVWVRRLVTMIPSFFVIGAGLEPQVVLVFTQVVLSFVLPFALIPLVMMSSREDVMGSLVNSRATALLSYAVTAVVVALNAFLVAQTLGWIH